MAATLTLTSATPYALKYRYDYDGNASQTADVLKAQLLIDAATAGPGPSPLLQLLSDTIDPDWSALEGSAKLSVFATMKAQTVGASGIGAELSNPASAGLRLRVTGLGLQASDAAVVELRFNHTLDR